MNTISLAGVIVIIILIVLVLTIRSYKSKPENTNEDMLFWLIHCTVFTGSMWVDKELPMGVDLQDSDITHTMAEAHVEQYMKAMRYPHGEYTIGCITRLSPDEYISIRKDLFVTLHGYCYE